MIYILIYIWCFRYCQMLYALDHLQSYQDMKLISAEALKIYPADSTLQHLQRHATRSYEMKRNAVNVMSLCDTTKWMVIKMGKVLLKPYPWASRVNTRTKMTIEVANNTLGKCSKVLRIQPSTVDISGSHEISYGMFATKDIHAGDIVLESSPVLCVKKSQLRQHKNLLDSLIWKRKIGSEMTGTCFNCFGSLRCASRKYGFVCCAHLYFCSRECRNIAQQYYHEGLCGMDISHIYADAEGEKCFPSGPEISKVVWLRLLATCKQGGGHPLQHPLVAHLVSHEAQADDPWSLETRVITPLKILHKLGVDIFADKCFDTWILETLWYVNLPQKLFSIQLMYIHRQRFRINAVGGLGEENEYECWVDGSYAMFNHSCENPPMICLIHTGSGSKFQCRAGREIKKGEEVFVCYIEELSKSTEERRQMLNGWLSGDCMCRRCLLG
ncbi:hypothetical protein OCU04_010294 [Sclerotinia nivalis]|uniref:SET domain-containing protein n=1 Tax=Sclerotinia nivalis TaxID=352851 RepID=A0A9X0AEE9_9HELO|nr:hypothetical protein OCU04_010294 [Sclerotinia nivalis]